MIVPDLSGRHVVVWGAGREGWAAVEAASSAGAASVVVVDDHPAAGVVSGERLPDVVASAEVLLLSPGIPPSRPEVSAARSAGAVVSSGTALHLAEHGSRTVAVTGSKGKSTTTRLLVHLLSALGVEAVEGGNVGVPLLSVRDRSGLFVAEVSSYQAALLTMGPRVGVLTSLFPDHLPWHGGVEGYYRDKLRLLSLAGTALVNGSDPGVRDVLDRPELRDATVFASPGARVTVDGTRVVLDGVLFLDAAPSRLPGPHNVANVAAAAAVLDVLHPDVLSAGPLLQEALEAFVPLPHRLQTVGTWGGVTFVDDTLATTPQAAVRACETFPDVPLVLLAGGLDRGLDLSVLVRYLSARSARTPVVLYGMGPVGCRLVSALGPAVRSEVCDDLAEATRRAAVTAAELGGGVVLLSPSAASPPEYGDYLARSRVFAAAVASLDRSPGR